MVKLYALSIFRRAPEGGTTLLKGAYDLQSFGFFQRGSVQEFMTFTSQMLVERTQPGSRQSVKEQEYICHVFVRADGLAAVLVSDAEYPQRVSHTLLTKAIEDCAVSNDWKTANTETLRNYKALDAMLMRYQNPREADALTRIQAELDETKIIMHNTIEAVLERGEKLDDLVAKSEGLSSQSKMFYKTARKTNSCCNF
jgi:synaptobrevin family protein YKT6